MHWVVKDRMTPGERVGEGVAILLMLAMAAFFVSNQVQQTGFFTSAFGPLEMLLFYACVPMGLALNGAKMVLGRRNLARPLETVNAALMIVSSAWFFAVFPFDFTHFSALVPNVLKFAVSWIPNWLARDLLVLGFVAGIGNLVYNPIMYFAVRRAEKVDVALTR